LRSCKYSLPRGFTLIELLVVVAMVAILLSLAAPSFNATRLNQKLASSANDLYASLLQARNEALVQNRRVTVAPITAGDWKPGWRIYVDMNNNGSFDSGTDTFIVSSGAVDDSFTVTDAGGGAAPTDFSFDSRGFLRGSTANRVVFTSPKTSRAKHVIVFATGRSRICDPKFDNAACSD